MQIASCARYYQWDPRRVIESENERYNQCECEIIIRFSLLNYNRKSCGYRRLYGSRNGISVIRSYSNGITQKDGTNENNDDLVKYEYRVYNSRVDHRILISQVATASWVSCIVILSFQFLITTFSIAVIDVLDAPLSNFNDLNLHIQDDSSGIKLTINKEKGARRHLEQVFLPRIKLREKGTEQVRKSMAICIFCIMMIN